MILPYGAGYSRVLAPSQSAPAGLAPSQLVRDGRVFAQVIGLEQEDQLPCLAAYSLICQAANLTAWPSPILTVTLFAACA